MSQAASASSAQGECNEFRRGWPVVLACFGVATFAWGIGFYGQAVFLAELHAIHGWSSSLIASATTVNYLVGAVLLTRVHRVIGSLGPRLLLASGVVIMAASAVAMSRVASPWQLYLCSIVMAAGWASTTTTAIAVTLALWFDRRRGFALSLALTGASAGGFAVAPMLVEMVRRTGLEQAVLIVAAGGLILLLPLVLTGVGAARPPAPASGPRREASRNVLGGLHFWTIALPFALALLAQVGFIIHQVAFLLPQLGSRGAGAAVAATAVAAALGRLALAPLIDRVNQRIASAASFTSQACGLGLMLLFPQQPAALYVGSVVFGLSVGNVITLPALIVQREFAPASFGQVVGLCSMVGQATLAFGPTLLGLARDATGSYAASLLLCIAMQLIAAAAVLLRYRG